MTEIERECLIEIAEEQVLYFAYAIGGYDDMIDWLAILGKLEQKEL
jgi:hypothetical protein